MSNLSQCFQGLRSSGKRIVWQLPKFSSPKSHQRKLKFRIPLTIIVGSQCSGRLPEFVERIDRLQKTVNSILNAVVISQMGQLSQSMRLTGEKKTICACYIVNHFIEINHNRVSPSKLQLPVFAMQHIPVLSRVFAVQNVQL